MEQKFYICKHCGNIIAKVKGACVWIGAAIASYPLF